MKVSSAVFLVPVSAIAALLALAGCAGNPSSRYYALSGLPDTGGPGAAAIRERGVAIGVGPVRLPEYLNRPQIVTRMGSNEFQFAEFHQWAGPLEGEVARVLAENLAILLPTDRVAVFPWSIPYAVQYRVEVTVLRFEPEASGEIVLTARWRIVGKDGREEIRAALSSLREVAGTQDYGAAVAAMSRALGGLSREIADALRQLPPTYPSPSIPPGGTGAR